MLRDVPLFLWSVFSFWQALATGCIFFVIASLFERWYRGHFRWRVPIGLLSFFLVVAIFRAWDDEFRRAQELAKESATLLEQAAKERAVIREKERQLDELRTRVEIKLAESVTRPAVPAVRSGPSGTLQNAPGGVIAGGDVTVQTAPMLIQSIWLTVDIVKSLRDGTPGVTHEMAGSGWVAFATHGGSVVRFASSQGLMIESKAESAMIHLSVTPVNPDEILGRPIEYLTTIAQFGIWLDGASVPGDGDQCTFDLDLRVNGAAMLAMSRQASCEALTTGKAMDLGGKLVEAVARYKALSRH